MKSFHNITFILLLVGGLNWLLFAIAGWDISSWLGGPQSLWSRALYVLVGLSAIYEVATHKDRCKECAIT